MIPNSPKTWGDEWLQRRRKRNPGTSQQAVLENTAVPVSARSELWLLQQQRKGPPVDGLDPLIQTVFELETIAIHSPFGLMIYNDLPMKLLFLKYRTGLSKWPSWKSNDETKFWVPQTKSNKQMMAISWTSFSHTDRTPPINYWVFVGSITKGCFTKMKAWLVWQVNWISSRWNSICFSIFVE